MYDAEAEIPTVRTHTAAPQCVVEALSKSATHSFSKEGCRSLTLLEGLGVQGDAHCGATDQHLFLGKPNPPPNLRQIHLFAGETMDAMRDLGFAMTPGAIGENVVTRGLDLLELPLDTLLAFPSGACVQLTGRRTPCRLVDRLGKGLMKALGGSGAWGERPIAGAMAIVLTGGEIQIGDRAKALPPPQPHRPLPGL